MIKQGVIVGAVVGFIVVGVRSLYAFTIYKPEISGMFNFSLYGLFAEAPGFWAILGIPFGTLIGVIIVAVFHYLSAYGLIKWPILNAVLGAILGWFVTVILFRGSHYLSREIQISWGFILDIILVYFQAFIFLQIPGAIIGAIVGFLFNKDEKWFPIQYHRQLKGINGADLGDTGEDTVNKYS